MSVFISNREAIFKLRTGVYYMIVVERMEKAGVKRTVDLYSVWGAGFARFSYFFFQDLLTKGYINYSHSINDKKSVYTPYMPFLEAIEEETSMMELINWNKLIRKR
ncbi:MAG: hypothetical protein H8D23_00015 [Candidatus Brocadiales bacterium]|nr:hypothetical protein [Candidatus Brocadiales bacterium]